MACPTCNATMQNLGTEGRRTFWCPRCGTLKTEAGVDDARDVFVGVAAPSLVGYVRGAAAKAGDLDLVGYSYALPDWHWRAVCEAAGVKLP